MAINAYDKVSFAQFQPITLQEMMIPAQYLREQEDKLNEDLNEQQLLNAAAKSQLIKGLDDAEIARTEAIENQISTLADDLSKNGFNAVGRRTGLNNIRKDYNSTILPIQQSTTSRAKLADFQQQMLIKDPTIKFNRMAYDIAASEGVENPAVYSQITGISGNELAKQVSVKVAPIAKRLSEIAPQTMAVKDPNGRPIAYQYIQMIRNGATAEEVAAIMSGRDKIDPNTASEAARAIVSAIDNTVAAAGVYDIFGDSDTARQLWNAAAGGAFTAIGTPVLSNVTDTYGMQSALAAQKFAQDLQLIQARAAAKGKTGTTTNAGSGLYPKLTPSNYIITDRERANHVLELQKRHKEATARNAERWNGGSAGSMWSDDYKNFIRANVGVRAKAYTQAEKDQLYDKYMKAVEAYNRSVSKSGTIGNLAIDYAPTENPASKSSFLGFIDKYTKENENLWRETGVTTSDLDKMNFDDAIKKAQDRTAVAYKDFVISPENDKSLYNSIMARIVSGGLGETLVRDSDGVGLDEDDLSKILKTKPEGGVRTLQPELRPGFELRMRPGGGLIILDHKEGEAYTVSLKQLNSNLTATQEAFLRAGNQPDTPEYEAILQGIEDELRELYTPEQIRQAGYIEPYDEVIRSLAEAHYNEQYMQAAQDTFAELNFENKPLLIKPE